MDTYRGVALGVESAWPAFVYGDKESGASSRRSGIFAVFDLARALAGLARLTGRGDAGSRKAS
jgi:hypothetical protein